MSKLIDSPEFTELLIAHIIRDRAVFEKARELKITADDFGSAETSGNKIYREFVSIALVVNEPVGLELFRIHVKDALENHRLDTLQLEAIVEFITFIYDQDLNSQYVLNHLVEYLKRKRSLKLKIQYKDDDEALHREYNKLVLEIRETQDSALTEVFSPFESLSVRQHVNVIPTGIAKLDSDMLGLGLQEMAYILGNSGGGKSLLGCLLCKNAAIGGHHPLYVTLEEPGKVINNRFYSSAFNISYTNLHRDLAGDLLAERFNSMVEAQQQRLKNVKVLDLRKLRPITPTILKMYIANWCEQHEYPVDLLMIDQLEFLDPDTKTKGSTEAQDYERLSGELEQYTNELIHGNPFAMYIQHQLKGKLKETFTMDDIANCKAIVRKADTAITIGRKDATSDIAHITSIKSRHSKNFHHVFRANFEFMQLADYEPNMNTGNGRPMNNFRPALPSLGPISGNSLLRAN